MAGQMPSYHVLNPAVLFDMCSYTNYYLCFKEVFGSSNTHFLDINLS